MSGKRLQGFSLIELMIALAILAIVAAIAVPAYQGQIRKVQRGDAQGDMLGLASAMEKFYLNNRTFAGADPKVLYSDQSPSDTRQPAKYILSIEGANRRDFTIVATPQKDQKKDGCGTLTLTRSGARGMRNASLSQQECWRG